MVKEDEEKKRRQEDINRLFRNHDEISNDNKESIYQQRQNDINNLFNISTNINKNNTIKRNELKEHLNSINNKKMNDITITSYESENMPQIISVQNVQNEEKNNEIEQNLENNTGPTVTKQNENFREQNMKNNNIFEANNESNVKIANSKESSKEISNASDLYLASNGEVDRRNNTEKMVDMITGVTGNFMEGVQDFIPSVIDYINSGEQIIAKNNIKNGLKFLGYSEEETESITQRAMDNYNHLSPISQLNLLLNNDTVQNRRSEKIQKNTLKASSNPLSRQLAEIAPSIGSNVVSMAITAANPVLGMTSFMVSAGGSYLDDAKSRGMTDDEAFGYATVMGIFEGRYRICY